MALDPIQLVEFGEVERAITSTYVSPSPAQSIEPVAVDGELTRIQASHKPAQCINPGAVGKDALAHSSSDFTLSVYVLTPHVPTLQPSTGP